MAEISLKEQFLRLLNQIVRDSGTTRAELCDRLGISASAVSQMLSGDMLPTVRRLDQIIELLHPAADDAEKLQNMLLWLRSGSSRKLSEFNRRLFMARCQNSLTIEQLALASAIPASRLRRLERTAYAEPTMDEAATLSHILGQALVDGLLMPPPAPALTPVRKVAESADDMVLPRITLERLSNYFAGDDILRFAERNGCGFLAFHLLPAEAVAAVRAPAERFGAALPGTLELVLGNDRPYGFMRIELCRERSGDGFFMDGDGALAGCLWTADSHKRAAAWRLPVLQVNHIPQGGFDGKN